MADERIEGVAELKGHPLEGPAGGAATDVQPKGEGTPEGTKIRFGTNHEFNSVEELTQAYMKLESALGEQGRKIGEMRTVDPARVAVPPRPRRTLDFKKLGDAIIENPEAGIKEIVGYVEETVEERVAAAEAKADERRSGEGREDRIWNKFFSENQWLDHRQEEVKLIAYNMLWPRLQGRPPEEQFKQIADHFRETTVRSVDVLEGKPLSTVRPAAVVPGGPSGGTPPRTPQAEQKPKSFLDSVREKSHVPKSSF